MKIPTDVSHRDLINLLEQLGYRIARQTGSHIRLTHPGPPEHHLSVPRHKIVRVGTLHAILSLAAEQLGMNVRDLIERL